MRIRRNVWLAVLLCAGLLQAQEASRDKAITIERRETRVRPAQDAAPDARTEEACDGANYATNAFNDNILMGGPIVAIAWTPAASATVSRVEVFTGEAATPAALGIWSDDGAAQSRPLAHLGSGPFTVTTPNSWQGADLLPPVAVTAGTKYWIVFDPSGGEQAPVQNGTGQQYWGSYTGTITSVAHSDWFGPFSHSDHAWKFRVFCLLPPLDVYAAKFLCGSFLPKPAPTLLEERDHPVKPGNYFTVINLHNPNRGGIEFRKKAVLLYRADDPPKPEQPMPPGRLFPVSLRPDWGLAIDCADIREVLLKGMAPPAPAFIEGWVILEVTGAPGSQPRPIDVTAVYTSHGWDQSSKTPAWAGFAQDVETIRPTRARP